LHFCGSFVEPWNRLQRLRSAILALQLPTDMVREDQMSFRNALFACVCLTAFVPVASAEEAIKVKASDKAACMPDAIRLCRDAIPNVRNVLTCFSQNREKISARCTTVLAGYGF
jgi:hypothetical protein